MSMLNIISEEVEYQSKVDLSGTLTLPKLEGENFPAALIIGGTGGLNRDGNGLGFKMNIYKDMAETLTDLNMVCLRYDKRGVGKSTGNGHEAGVDDLVDDVMASVKFLKNHPKVNAGKIILVGHSEGCILASLASEQIDVSGLVLLSGAGVSMKTSMNEQAKALLDEARQQKGLKGVLLRIALTEKSVIQKQTNLFKRVLESKEDVIRVQLMKFPAKWLRQHLSYSDDDIIERLKNFGGPILAITGDKDVQTSSDHIETLKQENILNLEAHVVKNMDHMLKNHEGAKSLLEVKKQYKKAIGLPLHPQLVMILNNWLLSHVIS